MAFQTSPLSSESVNALKNYPPSNFPKPDFLIPSNSFKRKFKEIII
jgi:hypothetical protein